VQRQPILARDARGLRRETSAIKHAVKPVAGFVPCEHAARPVRPMSARSQPEDKHARLRIAKTWNRFTPVLALAVGPPFYDRNAGGMFAQTGAPFACDDLSLKDFEQMNLN
jgi:hypothetical protein